MEIINTPYKFKGKGEVKEFTFTLYKKNDHACIYKVENDISGKEHFEVFKLKLNPVCEDFKRQVYSKTVFKVQYPKSNHFGVWAWTFHCEKSAINKFENIR